MGQLLTFHSQSRSGEWGEEGVSERHREKDRDTQRGRDSLKETERAEGGKEGERKKIDRQGDSSSGGRETKMRWSRERERSWFPSFFPSFSIQ